jgi:hypothetical protein
MYSLKNYLENNTKVESVKAELQESLKEHAPISRLVVTLKTDRNLYNMFKSVYIEPTDDEKIFKVSVYIEADVPSNTLLADLYKEYRLEDWQKAKYGHCNPKIVLGLSQEDLMSVINWKFSKIN